MSRVIKFRAWHKAEQKMYPAWGMLNDMIMLLIGEGAITAIGYSKVELMQFIGLKDKKGQDVYEGDIVDSSVYDSNWLVAWCDGKGEYLGSQVGWILTNGHYTAPLEAHHSITDDPDREDYLNGAVIGNMYQNPELLPKEE